MTIRPDERVSTTTEADFAKINFQHKCNTCGRIFPTLRGKQIHEARWCNGDPNQRSRRGTLPDQHVRRKKQEAAVDELDHVTCGKWMFQNVYNFTNLGNEISADGSNTSDVERKVYVLQHQSSIHCTMCGEMEDCHVLCKRHFVMLELCYCCSIAVSHGSSVTPPARRSVDSMHNAWSGSSTQTSTQLSVKGLVMTYSKWHTGDAGCGHLLRTPRERLSAKCSVLELNHNYCTERALCRNCVHGH